MFITACDIYIKSENKSRLYILLYYELKFNRNKLFMFKHIFSIKNVKHKWFLLVITHVHSLNKYIFLSMFIVYMFDICNHAITVLFYFLDLNNCHLQIVNIQSNAKAQQNTNLTRIFVRVCAPERAPASSWRQSLSPCGLAHRPRSHLKVLNC